jgi:hypothetical protein
MEIQVSQLFQRPNVNVPWFHDTWQPSHMEYINTNYKDTGKYKGSREITSDGLMLIVTHTFTDQAALEEFTNDSYLSEMAANRDAYNLANGIERWS